MHSDILDRYLPSLFVIIVDACGAGFKHVIDWPWIYRPATTDTYSNGKLQAVGNLLASAEVNRVPVY